MFPSGVTPSTAAHQHRSAAQADIVQQLEQSIRNGDIQSVRMLRAAAINNPAIAPDARQTSQLLHLALTSNHVGFRREMAALPHFNPRLVTANDGRSLLWHAARTNDVSFCAHLLCRGADIKTVADIQAPSPEMQQFLHSAAVIDKLGLPSEAAKGLSPILYALSQFNTPEAWNLLEKKINIPLAPQNLEAVLAAALQDKAPDTVCALLALMPRGWIEHLAGRIIDHAENTYLHEALKFNHAGLKRVVKEYPYLSKKRDASFSLVGEATFPNGSKIMCGPIAASWGVRRLLYAQQKNASKNTQAPTQAKNRFDATDFGSIDALEKSIPQEMEYLQDRMLVGSEDVHILDSAVLNEFIEAQLAKLETRPWREGEPDERIVMMGICSTDHAMTAACIIKRDSAGQTKDVLLFKDPNFAIGHKRAASSELQTSRNWHLPSLVRRAGLPTYLAMGRELVVFIYPEEIAKHPEKAKDFAPAPLHGRRIQSMPQGNARFTPAVLGFLLRSGRDGTLRDLQDDGCICLSM